MYTRHNIFITQQHEAVASTFEATSLQYVILDRNSLVVTVTANSYAIYLPNNGLENMISINKWMTAAKCTRRGEHNNKTRVFCITQAAASWSCDESDHVSKGATQLQGNEQKLYKKVAHVKVHIITNLTKSNLHNNTDTVVASLNHTPMIAFCTKHSPFVFHLATSLPTDDHRCCCLQMSPKGWWPPWLGCW